MCYFSFQAELEDQLYSLQPSLFFNDVVTLKDRVDLSQKIIIHALYYVRRVPFWMLAVYCVDGLNVYYQMLQHIAQCVRNFSIRYIRYTRYTPATTVPKLPLCHSSPECTMACRQIKKEHLNQVAHCLSEYLERLLRSTDYETNLNLQYHDELCINVSRINRCSMKFFNSIVCRKVCKLTDPLHYHKRLSKKIDRACQLQVL